MDEKQEKCVPCEIVLNGLLIFGVAVIAFLAWDTLSDGAASEWLNVVLGKSPLAAVIPISGDEDTDASA